LNENNQNANIPKGTMSLVGEFQSSKKLPWHTHSACHTHPISFAMAGCFLAYKKKLPTVAFPLSSSQRKAKQKGRR
jgi:hypothetical protein